MRANSIEEGHEVRRVESGNWSSIADEIGGEDFVTEISNVVN